MDGVAVLPNAPAQPQRRAGGRAIGWSALLGLGFEQLLAKCLNESISFSALPRKALCRIEVAPGSIDYNRRRAPEQNNCQNDNQDSGDCSATFCSQQAKADKEQHDTDKKAARGVKTHRRDVLERYVFSRSTTEPAFGPVVDDTFVCDRRMDFQRRFVLLALPFRS